jgi:RNA polymerase sigma-70 factor (ECF subfamily)
MPDEPETHGLLALMLLHDARRAARVRDGELVLLHEQDRELWDAAETEAGNAALARARSLGGGVYTLQASIAALHASEPRDWAAIADVYAELAALTGSPVVELNRAVAVAEIEGPEAALARVDRLDLDGYQYFHAARADFLRRLERLDEARTAYGRALELASAEPERRFLERRIRECSAAAAQR